MTRFGAAFRWHLRRERIRILVFGLVTALLVGIWIACSTSMQLTELNALLERSPSLRVLFGHKAGDVMDMQRWVGRFHVDPLFLFATLGFPVAAALRGVAGGVEDGTLEMVLAQPIRRSTYYLALAAVLAVGVTVCLACSLATCLLLPLGIELPGPLPVPVLFAFTASAWALAISVGGIALLVSALGAGTGRSAGWIVWMVVFMFFVRFLSLSVPELEWLRWGSVFGYHAPKEIVQDGPAASRLLALLTVAVACAAAGYWVFRRKQLTF